MDGAGLGGLGRVLHNLPFVRRAVCGTPRVHHPAAGALPHAPPRLGAVVVSFSYTITYIHMIARALGLLCLSSLRTYGILLSLPQNVNETSHQEEGPWKTCNPDKNVT